MLTTLKTWLKTVKWSYSSNKVETLNVLYRIAKKGQSPVVECDRTAGTFFRILISGIAGYSSRSSMKSLPATRSKTAENGSSTHNGSVYQYMKQWNQNAQYQLSCFWRSPTGFTAFGDWANTFHFEQRQLPLPILCIFSRSKQSSLFSRSLAQAVHHNQFCKVLCRIWI